MHNAQLYLHYPMAKRVSRRMNMIFQINLDINFTEKEFLKTNFYSRTYNIILLKSVELHKSGKSNNHLNIPGVSYT